MIFVNSENCRKDTFLKKEMLFFLAIVLKLRFLPKKFKNRLTKEGKGGKIVKLSERAGTTEQVDDKKRKNNLNFFKKGIDK